MRQGLVRWLIWWAGFTGLWLTLVDTSQVAEVLAGVLAGAAATVVVRASHAKGLVRLDLRRRWLRLILRIPGRLLRDCWLLAGALWRRIVRRDYVGGDFRTVSFSGGDIDDPRSSARRAVVTVVVSTLPNSYVLGIDTEDDFVLLHELVTSGDEKGLPL